MIKHKLLLSVLACLLLLLAIVACGCNSSNQANVESIEASLRVVNMDTGLEILLIPRGSQGFIVKTDGILDAKLWLQESLGGEVRYDQLIQGWDDIQISIDDYTLFQGVKVDLIYDEEIFCEDTYGSLEVTLTTPDGKSLTDTISDIAISENYVC